MQDVEEKPSTTRAGGKATKKRRVSFDEGVEANECMKIFLASCPDEVGSLSSTSIEPSDLNQFFGEDGKIYGYKDLHINVWISTISFNAYAEVSSCSVSKGATDVKEILQKIFGDTLLEKDAFMDTFSKECDFLWNTAHGESIVSSTCEEGNDESSVIEVIYRSPHPLLYARLLPLVLLLIEGSTPIESITDPRWKMLTVVRRKTDSTRNAYELLGFATVFHFYRYPESRRLRICQIMVLPPHQRKGYGRLLLEGINTVAMSDDVHDITVEDPSDYLHVVRACMDCVRLISSGLFLEEINIKVSMLRGNSQSQRNQLMKISPSATVVELARRNFKMYQKHFLWCWNVIIYLNADDTQDEKALENFRACIYNRVKSEMINDDTVKEGKCIVELPSDLPEAPPNFAMYWTPSGDGEAAIDMEPEAGPTEEQLNQFVDEEVANYADVAAKVRAILSKARDRH